jgi:hypothetical protein
MTRTNAGPNRIKQLEAKVKKLEETQSVTAPVPEAAPTPTPPPEVEMPNVNGVAPRLKLILFGDVGAQGYTHTPDPFSFGSLDLFARARLSDKVFVLGEILFVAQNNNVIRAGRRKAADFHGDGRRGRVQASEDRRVAAGDSGYGLRM